MEQEETAEDLMVDETKEEPDGELIGAVTEEPVFTEEDSSDEEYSDESSAEDAESTDE